MGGKRLSKNTGRYFSGWGWQTFLKFGNSNLTTFLISYLLNFRVLNIKVWRTIYRIYSSSVILQLSRFRREVGMIQKILIWKIFVRRKSARGVTAMAPSFSDSKYIFTKLIRIISGVKQKPYIMGNVPNGFRRTMVNEIRPLVHLEIIILVQWTSGLPKDGRLHPWRPSFEALLSLFFCISNPFLISTRFAIGIN